ncbi:putative ATP-dependent RNA helicase TDRD12 [Adelges cooleyi]|uniref:putative ATP-dependent RNA helicase TDRD12 n=1 Tax=Adelges cooleyi TaxID=133065 RepID=UPI00217F8FB5|nr:putative ATP-dependent RNA helicase TDRD12 [Adelges cooleyi]XP_050443641.1 putative ATP-dependent RNA helicase TDRD12 [Adelges cooleyi]
MFGFIKIPFINSENRNDSPFLCNQIKLLGHCKKTCGNRHEVSKVLDSNSVNIPNSCFVTMKLLKVNSASNFCGRISKYSTVNDPTKESHWVEMCNTFNAVKEDLKLIASDSKTLCSHPKIGDMVMVDQEELYRAIVLDISGWFSQKLSVKLIDTGSVAEVHTSKVFVLPNHLKDICPAVFEVCMSSVKPIGAADDWPVTTTALTRSLLEPAILEELEFIGKVEFVMGSTLWISWLLVKKCKKCSHFACKLYNNSILLPRELIDRNLAEVNTDLIDNLIGLCKAADMWQEQPSKTIVIKKALLFSTEDKITTSEITQPQWAHLSDGEIYTVDRNYVEHTKCFLVRNCKFIDRVKILEEDINKFIDGEKTEKLTDVAVGTVCLARAPEGEHFNRVLIKEVNDQYATVLYLDYGDLCLISIHTLLAIPTNLISQLPFQVIECGLSGFKNVFQNNSADEEIINHFLSITDNEIYLKVLSYSTDSKLTNGSHYEVVLFNKNLNVNVELANVFQYYIDDVQIKNILDADFQCPESIDDEDYDDDYDDDIDAQCRLLESLFKTSTEEAKESPKDLEQPISTNNEHTLVNGSNKEQVVKKNDISINKFKYCQKCNQTPVVPLCYWHQDNSWIYFKLNILSVNNYQLDHTIDSISITVDTNTVTYRLTIELYAFIKEDLFTCNISFDGICIKARKLIETHYKWPRLTKCQEKHKYLTYDTEHVSERLNRNLWVKKMSNYKMMAIGQPLNVSDSYASEEDSSDNEDYTIFED